MSRIYVASPRLKDLLYVTMDGSLALVPGATIDDVDRCLGRLDVPDTSLTPTSLGQRAEACGLPFADPQDIPVDLTHRTIGKEIAENLGRYGTPTAPTPNAYDVACAWSEYCRDSYNETIARGKGACAGSRWWHDSWDKLPKPIQDEYLARVAPSQSLGSTEPLGFMAKTGGGTYSGAMQDIINRQSTQLRAIREELLAIASVPPGENGELEGVRLLAKRCRIAEAELASALTRAQLHEQDASESRQELDRLRKSLADYLSQITLRTRHVAE